MERSLSTVGVAVAVAAWTAGAGAAGLSRTPQAAAGPGAGYTVALLPLPARGARNVSMDYIAYDAATNAVWVPGGNTGTVFVVDAATRKVRTIDGMPTSTMTFRGGTRVLGPSGVSIGDGVVYIGNRGDSSVCSSDQRSLARDACGKLDSMPDGVAYVAATQEVWVTTPRDNSLRILDAKTLAQKDKLTYDGNPEGYAVDAARGRFYTNLESKDRTLAIDLKTHKTLATWNPSCGEDGPHGLGLDGPSGHLFVACSTLAEVLDVGHDGAVLSKVETGDGVDDIHYMPSTNLLYVGAGRAARLTVARVSASGQLSTVVQVHTHQGARNATVSRDGTVFLAHGGGVNLPALVVVSKARK